MCIFMNKETINIIWCKKNLRIYDNEILSNLDPQIATLWVYFFEPSIMQQEDFSVFHLQFIFESLCELQLSFLKLGIPLIFLPYDALEWFQFIEKFYAIETLYSHEETWNLNTYKRDIDIVHYCKNNKIHFLESPTNWVVRRLKNRDHWHVIWQDRMTSDLFSPKKIIHPIVLSHKLWNISKKTKLHYINFFKKSHNSSIQKWWETMALRILWDFLTQRSTKYMYHISKPYESQSWCSRLSSYISYGCISLKTVVQACEYKRIELEKVGTEQAKNHRKSLQYFLSRLHWQSHFIQKLEDEPEIEYRNVQADFNTIRQEIDETLIEAVFSAKSGIPYIDATIKQLQQTWWCNFRSRAILVSFLCNTCMQPWQAVSKKIAALFTDYEPWIHYSQIQMQAGTTGMNTIRIYNPVYNWQKKDLEWRFIYHFLPELKDVPKKYIHEPHIWEYFDSLDYPKPIVDIKTMNKIARDALWAMKWNVPKSQKAKTVKKHASRVFKTVKKSWKRQSHSLQTSLF